MKVKKLELTLLDWYRSLIILNRFLASAALWIEQNTVDDDTQ